MFAVGPRSNAPVNFGCTYSLAPPALARSKGGHTEQVNACALDVWSVGSMLLRFFTGYAAWNPPGTELGNFSQLQDLLRSWVGSCWSHAPRLQSC